MRWPTVPLKEIAPAQTSNIRFSSDEPVWHLTLDQIESHTGNIVNKKIAPASAAGTSTNVFDDGNVLYSKLRPYLNKVLCPTEPGIATTELVPLRPRKDLLERRYLTYYLRSNHFLGFANVAVAGVKMPRIIMAKFWKHHIPLPPLSEQQRIVEILDQANALRKKRAEADAIAARILPALFYKMFGDPATNPKGWNIKPLSDFEAQVRYGLGQPPKASTTGVALIRATNISRGTISPKNMIYVDPQDVPPGRSAFLKEDEVLVVRSGAYTGDIAQVTKEWEGCVAGYDLVITPGRYLTGEFVEAYLLMPFIQKGYFYNLKARAGQPHLNAAQVAATPFLDVPKDLQVQFSEAVQSIRILRKQRVAASDNLEKAFAVMLHRAFTGDLTVKWRMAHMKKLLAEMEAQAKALDCPSTQSKSPEIGSKRHAGHDMYNKAALAAYITDRCHAPDRPMGRVKLAKLFYLVQQKAEIELTQTFMKRAAGPLDDEIHKFLSLAQKSKWLVLCRGEGDLKPVRPGANVSKAVEQAQKLLGPAKAKVDEMLDQMKGWGYRALERWATVLDASFELTAAGQSATVEGVKDVIQRHPDWVPKLSRDEFSDTNIEATLKGLRGFGFITNQD